MSILISFGAGNMAQALIPPLASDYLIKAYSPTGTRARILADLVKGEVLENLEQIKADVYFLCCKPQQFLELASSIKGKLSSDALVVSLLAGTTVETIKKELGHQNVLRLMPNTPSQYGHGVTLYYAEKAYTAFIDIMKKSNLMMKMKSEDQLDQVTAVTGSGPAYLFELARIMAEELESMEVDKDMAREMVTELFYGSSVMMKRREEDFDTLKAQVTSKGGVTYEALKVFAKENLSQMVHNALKANYNRSKELAKT